MATTDVTISVANPYPSALTVPSMAGTGGTWSAGLKSFMVVAMYDGTTITDVDMLGYANSTQANWNNFSVATADTAKQLTITWDVGSQGMPSYYMVLMQVGSSYNLANPGYVCAATGGLNYVAGTLGTMTIPTEPSISATTVTLGASYTSMTLVPVNLTPMPRDSAVSGVDGRVRRRSYAQSVPTLCAAVKLDFFGTTTTAANYKKLMKWAHKPVRVSVVDGDTNAYLNSWTGMLHSPSSLNSDSKQNFYPSLTLMVENESPNA